LRTRIWLQETTDGPVGADSTSADLRIVLVGRVGAKGLVRRCGAGIDGDQAWVGEHISNPTVKFSDFRR